MNSNAANYEFRRELRLLAAAEYSRVFKTAKRHRLNQFMVLTSPNELAYPRLGLAIAKKHAQLAVVRNRIKRCIRESFRLNQASLNGFDIVVVSRHGIETLKSPDMTNKLVQVWEKLAK